MSRNRLLGDCLNQLAQLETVSLLKLRWREERGVKKTDAGAQHADAQSLGLEGIQKLLQSDVLNLKTVPNLVQGDLAIRSLVFHLGTGNWFTETKERQCKVDETILVLLKIILAVDNLVELKHNQAGNQRSGRGNSGNDLSSDELGLVSISGLDLVVFGSQVTASSDEINVMVRVIILLEVNRNQLESRQRAGRGQGVGQLLSFVVIVEVASFGLLIRSVSIFASKI